MFDFLLPFSQVCLELTRLLEVRYVPEAIATDTAIGRSLGGILLLHNAGRFVERDLEVGRIAMVVKNLSEVESARPEVFEVFKRKLVVPGTGDYVGARQELVIASSLVRKGLAFDYELPGQADFLVTWQGEKVGIECSSIHLTELGQPRDLSYKVSSCIRAKNKKAYASPEVVLAIDVTNVAKASDEPGFPGLFSAPFKERTAEVLNASKFGSLLTFVVVGELVAESAGLGSKYARIDRGRLVPPLLSFLNAHFPCGDEGAERDAHFYPALP